MFALMEKSAKPYNAVQIPNVEAPLVSIIFSYTKSEVSDGHETVELLQNTENIIRSIADTTTTTNYCRLFRKHRCAFL